MSDEEHQARLAARRERARKRREADPAVREARRTYNREYARKRRQEPEFLAAHRERVRKHRANKTPEQRAREKYLRRRADPEKVAHDRAVERERARARKALPEGHPGTCELCGIAPKPQRDGKRGLCQDHRHDTGAIRGFLCHRCNIAVGVLDLRFTDPERFAALQAWSNRLAPTTPKPAENRERRRKPTCHPSLFPDESE